tara:strand:- start:2123 stop:2905 length:783 start_codon:yes stop_codon:yes gene_type:complete
MNLSQLELKKIANNCAKKIAEAQPEVQIFYDPYEHLILDNFFPDNLAKSCLDNFPAMDNEIWEHTNDKDIEVKSRTVWRSEFDIPESIVDAVRILNSSVVMNAMSGVFDIHKLLPDPYFTGGGLNVTQRGGLLDVHVDGNYHDASGLNRRLNALLYLNPNYKKNWGGEFGIYDKTGEVLVKKVDPIFNRLVIFNTHDTSFHGLPDPVNFPEGNGRKSIILYYYTKAKRKKSEIVVKGPHSALWKKRNLKDKKGNLTRDFD